MYFMYRLYIFKLNARMKATPGFLYLMILIEIDILTIDIMMKTILLSLPSYCSISPVVFPQMKLKFTQIISQGKVKSWNQTGRGCCGAGRPMDRMESMNGNSHSPLPF